MLNFRKINFQKYNRIWEVLQNEKRKKPIYQTFNTYGSLHDEIKKRTNIVPRSNEDLFKIILLIHKWGGVTGRYFLMNKKTGSHFEEFKKDKKQIDIYKQAANLAIEGNPAAFDLFCNIKGIGAAFASKHAYLWSTKRKPLIIIDKLIANFFGFNKPEILLKEMGSYTKLYELFKSESKSLGLKSILILERGIFQYVRENKV